jgi:hypothetical protein
MLKRNDPGKLEIILAKVEPHLPGQGELGGLLCDDRMKAAWRTLRAKAPSEVASKLKENERRLMKYLGLLGGDVSVADQACVAFLISVAWTIWNPSGRFVWTEAVAKEEADRWEDAAARCRWIANEPMFPHHQDAATEMAKIFEDNAKSLRQCGHLADLNSQELQPFILSRSSRERGEHEHGGGDDQVRGYTRAIAAHAHRLFGSYMYRTVARVATVALKKEVSPKSVENWCSSLKVSQ